jgi:aldehyde dehydrogenase (NAD+)
MSWKGNFDRLFIGGEWVVPLASEQIDVVSPFTEQVIASVPSASKADMDRAVAAARTAFDEGSWSRTTLAERIAIIARWRDLMVANRDVIAETITDEMGCPITQSRVLQAANPAAILGTYLEVAGEYPFRSLRRSARGSSLVTREPVGVVAAVIPWNVPHAISVGKIAPALIAGCTVVLKPAPEAPLDAYLLAEMLLEAGVPAGVVNVVPADREASEHLVTHPGVDKVTFTGSTAAGRRIASFCGQDLRRVTLELGGKSAAVILDDADLDAAVEALRSGSLRNSGQVCSLKTRIVVSRRRETELLDRLVGLVESMPVGDPSDPSTQIGPLVSARQRGVVENYIEIGRREGARTMTGGGRPRGLDHGWFVEPAIFTDVEPDMRIAQEEIFGPVVSVLTYEDEDQAVAIANNSPYGLNGAIFTSDIEHGMDLARRIRTGTVELNGNSAGFRAPMGGVKCSGIGREYGPEGIDNYVEPKSVGLPEKTVDALEHSWAEVKLALWATGFDRSWCVELTIVASVHTGYAHRAGRRSSVQCSQC